MNRKFGAISSSANPQEIAATVQGLMKVVGGVLVTFGYTSVIEVDTLVEQVGVMVLAGFAFWGAAETVFGLIRKAVVRVFAPQG
jgi:hypothetical protein